MITVFHNPKFTECTILSNKDLKNNILSQIENLQEVARVNTNSMEEAFKLTNHIDQNWTKNPEIISHSSKNTRSTSVGDVISLDGTCYAIANIGFVKLCPACPVSGMPCIEFKESCLTYCHLK